MQRLFTRNSFSTISPLQQLLSLGDTHCDESLVEAALGCDFQQAGVLASDALEKWREILAVVLTLRSNNSFETCLPHLLKRWRHLRTVAPWPESQLLSAYQAVVGALLVHRPLNALPELSIHQLPGGACPLETSGYSGSGEVPHPMFHAELGCLLFLYAEITGSTYHLKTALRLTEWQKNTLDYSCIPFAGLFSREGEAAEPLLVVHNLILFSAAAKASGEGETPIIWRLSQRLEEVDLLTIPAYLSALAQVFILGTAVQEHQKDRDSEVESAPLGVTIQDVSLALAGCRSEKVSAVATLFGGGSGMGCYHTGDIQIVSFGPQHMPLNDCRGFGLEGSGRLLAEQVREVRSADEEFVVAGTMRMVSASYKLGPSGIWIDACQKFKNDILTIETTFLDFPDDCSLAFSFFVRCPVCKVKGKTIKPRSLDRYFGASDLIYLEGLTSSIEITPAQLHSEMHVIPLGGEDNFWGADFLLSFILPPTQKQFSWTVRLAI
ncbi:MAG: hypothetical protein WCF65_10170 [Parachlamydiaceae bacterium]